METTKKLAKDAIKKITLGYTLGLIAGAVMLVALIFFFISLFSGVALSNGFENFSASSIAQIMSIGGMAFFLLVIIGMGLLALAGTILQLVGLEAFKKVLDPAGVDAVKKIIMSFIISICGSIAGNIIPYIGPFISLAASITSIVFLISGYSELRKSLVLESSDKGRQGTKLLYDSAIYSLVGALTMIFLVGFVFLIMSIVKFYDGWKLVRESFEQELNIDKNAMNAPAMPYESNYIPTYSPESNSENDGQDC